MSLAYIFVRKCLDSYEVLNSTIKCANISSPDLTQEEYIEAEPVIISNSTLYSVELNDDESQSGKETYDNSNIEAEYLEENNDDCVHVYNDDDDGSYYENIDSVNDSYFDSDDAVITFNNSYTNLKTYNKSEASSDGEVIAPTTIDEETIIEDQNLSTSKNEIEYKCRLCSLRFENGFQLVEHGTDHIGPVTNQKCKYQCHVCLKLLSSYHAYKNHVEIHAEDKYLCEICNASFSTKFRFTSHMIQHNPEFTTTFKCPYCSKVFLKQSVLDRHIPVHTGYKAYKCKLCDYSARVKENLKVSF